MCLVCSAVSHQDIVGLGRLGHFNWEADTDGGASFVTSSYAKIALAAGAEPGDAGPDGKWSRALSTLVALLCPPGGSLRFDQIFESMSNSLRCS